MAEQDTRLVTLPKHRGTGSKGFSITRDGGTIEGFVVWHEGQVYAYLNRCPHVGAPLDWMPDEFLNTDSSRIQCSMHGALFDIATGLCLQGPCSGRSLTPLAVFVRGREVHLTPR
jgi:nitrite reductase/ring-hydroxylating ferredoxin subunit